MIHRRRRLVALVLPLLLVPAAVGVAPTYAGAQQAAQAQKARKDVQQSGRIVVKWQGFQKRPKYVKTRDVPGIGQVELVCRPNATMVRIRANDRRAETQMWLAKFETKEGSDRVAVKNVRVFTYATAADDGTGGTGQQAHEGLNQQSPIEDFEKGWAYGVISQRPGRQNPGGGAMTLPATAFRLDWYWERFAYPGSQFCKMKLKLRTDTAQQIGLSWHGDDESGRNTTASVLPGFGEATLRCETGRYGEQSISLRPENLDGARMDYEIVRGEGPVADRIDRYSLGADPVTGLLGPVDLPTNGMMRIWWTVNGVKKAWALSSYMVTNNEQRPWLNLCEVAAAPMP